MEEIHSFNRDLLHATEPSGYHSRSYSSCSSVSCTSDAENVPLYAINSVVALPKTWSFWESLGIFYSVILIASTIILLSSIGFISFLWLADDRNHTWRLLASEDWITIAVAISSTLLRTAITSQAGLATAMLASIALESSQVLLSQLASISTIRNSNSGPYNLAWLFLLPSSLRARGWRGLLFSIVIAMLVLITFLSQGMSTALLSDIGSGLVSGFNGGSTIPTSLLRGSEREFLSTSTNAFWLRRPSVFAPFAEEFPNPSSGRGFEDTGKALRAFLPISERKDRVLLKSYRGSATVVDSRVVCFTPQLSEVDLLVHDDFFELFGNIAIPQDTIQLYNDQSDYHPLLVEYNSQAGSRGSSTNETTFICQADPTAFMTLCQLRPKFTGSFLVGELQKPPSSTSDWSPGYDNANQYIVLKLSIAGNLHNVSRLFLSKNSTHDPWLHSTFSAIDTPASPSLELDISLCYNTLSGVDVSIKATTNMTRSEAMPVVNNGSRTFVNVLNQLRTGPQNSKSLSPNPRGFLHLSIPSLSPHGKISNFTNNSDYIAKSVQQLTAISPFVSSGATAIQFSKDPSLGLTAHADYMTFFNDTQTAGGSLAFAMQSLFTFLVGTAYYDQLPNFDNNTVVEMTNFVQAQIPAGKSMQYSSSAAGFRRGYIGVLSLTVVHVVLMTGILVWYRMGTRISTLGNAWQSVAQILDPVTEKYIANASLASDSEVKRRLQRDGRGKHIVGIGLASAGRKTEIKGMDVMETNMEKEYVVSVSSSPALRPALRKGRSMESFVFPARSRLASVDD